MNFNKYRIIKTYYLLTFIGTIFHELAHVKFAKGRNLEIIDVAYFTLDNGKLGYVKHSPPRTYMDVFAVSVAPFIFNTSIGILTILSLFIYQSIQQIHSTLISPLILTSGSWFAISLLLHSIPSAVDIENTSNAIRSLWKRSLPSVLQTLKEKVSKTQFIVRIILSPVMLSIYVVHIVIFMTRHLMIIVTFPAIIIISVLNRTRRYGSAIFYTVGIVLLTWHLILPDAMIIIEKFVI